MCFYVALHGPSLDAFVQYTSCTGVDEDVERADRDVVLAHC